MEQLARRGYIAQSPRNRWMLKTSPEAIRVADLFRLFVYGSHSHTNDSIGRTVQQIMTPAITAADITMAEFIRLNQQQDS